jgi:hypothetical protein
MGSRRASARDKAPSYIALGKPHAMAVAFEPCESHGNMPTPGNDLVPPGLVQVQSHVSAALVLGLQASSYV